MKEKYLINARIIDPKNQMDEIGGLIIDINGKIKAVGKKVVNGNLPTKTEKIDLKKQILIPGIVDMRVFVGEPGYEYKENKEREIKRLSDEQLQLKSEIEQSKEDYEKIIDHTADQIEDFLKKASSNNPIQ